MKYELTGKFERLIVGLMRSFVYCDVKEIKDVVFVRSTCLCVGDGYGYWEDFCFFSKYFVSFVFIRRTCFVLRGNLFKFCFRGVSRVFFRGIDVGYMLLWGIFYKRGFLV